MSNNLLIQGPNKGVLLLILNRPEALNALNTALLGELSAALDAAEANPETRAVVITGSERAFAAGADINEMAARDLVGILKIHVLLTGNVLHVSPSLSLLQLMVLRWAVAVNLPCMLTF